MTVTDTPARRAHGDEAELLIPEARQRRKRRWLIGAVATAILVVLVGSVVGALVVLGGASHRPPVRPPAQPAVAPPPVLSSALGFSLRPVLCYAPPYSVAAGGVPEAGPLPRCAPASQLTAANLQVEPDQHNVDGYTSNPDVPPADPRFAAYPSTTTESRDQEVLLPGTPAAGPGRYVLGPVGLSRSGVARARATEIDGQWGVALTLTAHGSSQWDALAARQFHAVVGVVVDGRVVSVPIIEPTQDGFASFDGALNISGSFTEHQADVMASGL